MQPAFTALGETARPSLPASTVPWDSSERSYSAMGDAAANARAAAVDDSDSDCEMVSQHLAAAAVRHLEFIDTHTSPYLPTRSGACVWPQGYWFAWCAPRHIDLTILTGAHFSTEYGCYTSQRSMPRWNLVALLKRSTRGRTRWRASRVSCCITTARAVRTH